ncbi:MAG: cyclase family protein [Candidatus Brocadiia bacterium]
MTLRVWDISRPINASTPRYGEDPPPKITSVTSPEGWTVANVEITTHSGSHFDFERHFFRDGRTAECYPPSVFIGPCQVLLVPSGSRVDREFLAHKRLSEKRVLLQFESPEHCGLTADGADFLVESGCVLVGTNGLTVESTEPGFPVHRKLLASGILILENLELDEVAEARYILVALPLRISEADGSPCRALLVHPDDFQRLHNE